MYVCFYVLSLFSLSCVLLYELHINNRSSSCSIFVVVLTSSTCMTLHATDFCLIFLTDWCISVVSLPLLNFIIITQLLLTILRFRYAGNCGLSVVNAIYERFRCHALETH